jgi:PTS system nitrogen regulatory IIA component
MVNPAGAAEGAAGDGLVGPGRIFHRIPGATREEVLEELCARLAQDGAVGEPGELVARLIDREKLGCTGLGGGVAIPHCKLRDITGVLVAVATTAQPVDFGAADGLPIDLIFLVVSPTDAPAAHLQTLARISRLLRTPGVSAGLRAAHSPEEIAGVLRSAESSLAVSS